MTWNLEALSSVLQNDAAVKVVLSSESGPELCGALHRVRQLRSGDSSNVRVADDAILFIGTPHMTSLEDMATHNLYISGEGGDARIIPWLCSCNRSCEGASAWLSSGEQQAHNEQQSVVAAQVCVEPC